MDEIEEEQKFRKGFARMTLLFVIIIALVWGGYYLWSTRWSPEAREMQKYDGNVEKYQEFKANYETAMKADVYGGKTPQETLNMFISALEKGDIELAGKYFALEDNPEDPNYLTRKIWENQLKVAQADNRLSEIVRILKQSTPDMENRSTEKDFKFYSRSTTGDLEGYIDMQFNEFSGVWKIENL